MKQKGKSNTVAFCSWLLVPKLNTKIRIMRPRQHEIDPVCTDFRQALSQVALEKGGVGLQATIEGLAGEGPGWPAPHALAFLIFDSPETGEHIMERFIQIGEERRRVDLERADDRSPDGLRRRQILRGIGSVINLFPSKKGK